MMIGQTISHYKVLEKLGGGGMGVVYKAEDTRLKRTVALKFLPPDLTRDEEAKARFIHEAQSASGLQHPNICTVHDIDETGEGQLYIVLDLYEGETLKKRIERGPLKIDEAIDIAIQIAQGLEEAHKHQIVHRDIKPANVLITASGVVKIVDFGLAKLAGRTVLTKSGSTAGTAAYMSPEQARGEQVDRRTDIWSLGVVLYEMVTGQLPFKSEYQEAMVYSILNTQPEAITGLRSGVPLELERVVNKCLEKDKEYRYQQIDELLTDLKRVKRDTSEVSVVTGPAVSAAPDGPLSAKKLLRGLWVVMGGLAAVLIIALSVYFLIPKSNGIDSIAVLPFLNVSDDSLEYLSDGIAESLMNDLSRLSNLTVVSRTSAFRYKGKEVDPQKAGNELGVKGVLWGRLMQRGDVLLVSAELIDVSKNSHVWGEQYNRRFTDFIALREELTRKITDELGLRLGGAAVKKAMKGSTENPEAYQLYLKGRFYWNKRSANSLAKAVELFQNAISLDPGYALAYAGLADCYVVSGFPGPAKEKMPKAKSAALKAIELDETLSEPHATLAVVKQDFEWDWEGAEREFKYAIELNPNNATAHQWYGDFLGFMGRFEEAKLELQKAVSLDPLSPIINNDLAGLFYYAREYDSAIRQAFKALELDTNLVNPFSILGLAYKATGKVQDAMRMQLRSAELSGTPREYLAALRKASDRSDWVGFVKIRLNRRLEGSRQGYVSGCQLAAFYVMLGDADTAIQYLQKAYEDRDYHLVDLNTDPIFDPLRSDERFIALLQKLGIRK